MNDTVEFLRIIANQHRLRIIHLLYIESESVYMTAIRDEVQISKSSLSQHLAIMRDAGVIAIIPEGRLSYVDLTLTDHQENILAAIFEEGA